MDIHLVGGGGFDCNHYLVIHEGEALLVDAGTGLSVEATLETIQQRLDGASLDRIYLTHWHHDHTGGAPWLARELEAEILMPEPEAFAVRDGRSDITLGSSFGAEQEAHPVTGVEPGDQIELGDASLEVLHTPGHTAGHTSLYHDETRSLLAGDAVFSQGSFGRVDLPTGSASEMLDTLEALAAMDIEALYPGHVEVVKQGAGKHIELALSNARGML